MTQRVVPVLGLTTSLEMGLIKHVYELTEEEDKNKRQAGKKIDKYPK